LALLFQEPQGAGNMKKIILILFAIFSMSSFAQSYIVMDNGLILTTDSRGFAYDIGDYAFPLKITMKGGQFFVEENKVLATIDENGILFRKYEVMPEKVLGQGMNYFISDKGDIFTIDQKGVVHLSKNEVFKGAMNFGGNYFTVKSEAGLDLFVVTNTGDIVKAALQNLDMRNVIAFGGNYFMTNRGVLHTVSSEGLVISHANKRIGILQKRGGNYFTDSSGMIYTVAQDGRLIIPGLPLGLKINSINKLGSNYFLDLSGGLFTVDREGNIWERVVEDHDMRNARIISL
jgi:hypothetical protein